ncbi:MAG TPA: hypothetical protein VF711_13735 [Acidimicrobiales bacterium]|jgi:hypothetical protein
MSRRTIFLVVLVVALMPGVIGLTPPAASASAQVGYPPPPPQTTVVVQTLPPLPPPANVGGEVLDPGSHVPGDPGSTGADRSARVAGGNSARDNSAFAFTGANLLRWSLFALCLLAAGTTIVVVSRRRRARDSLDA